MAALLGAAIVVKGNATGPSSHNASSSVSFEREVTPFPVVDEHGVAFDMPFLGGMDVPRPQFVDIDGDGDYDLFLQEYPDQLWYFENTGTPQVAKYVWRTNSYQNLPIGEWFRFEDVDADGDKDLLAEQPYSYIRYYRNTGGPRNPQFVYADSLRDDTGAALFMDRQNIPAFADVDCDQRLDLLVGRVEGTVTHYEAIAPGSERFSFQGDRYQDIVVIGQADSSGTQRHGANALALADFDGDHDPDLFWGDYFERGALLIENVSKTCSTPIFTPHQPLPYSDTRTSGYNIPAPVDLDHDGDTDFLMGVVGGAFNPFTTSTNNFFYWERTAPDVFTFRTSRFLNGIDIGSESMPAVVDIDGDGDLDIIAGNKLEPSDMRTGRMHVMINEGTKTSPRYRMGDTLTMVFGFHQKPTLGDLDGDGDLDMLVGTWTQDVLYFRNDGTASAPRFVADSTRNIHPPKVSSSTPTLADIDGDGDLDLFVGEANGEINYFRNDGTARDARFVLMSERLDDIDVGRGASPTVYDIDGDGLLDLVVGRETAGVAAYRNVGTKTEPKFAEYTAFTLPLPVLSSPVFADITGDGVADLISGTASGGLLFFRGTRK
jgi:hypothetical protein